MDKRKVISAYRRGFLTLQECAQILGVDSSRLIDMVKEIQLDNKAGSLRKTLVNE